MSLVPAKWFLRLLAALCLGSVAAAQADGFKRGEVIPRVVTQKHADQSYALFLPSSYTPTKEYPAIFAFDPIGRGNVPVEMLKELAEKYGYIVAGTYNSRNGPLKPSFDAADAMIFDVTSRFAVDQKRMYTTGFSGGARLAATIALACNGCIAGVIANGAGFPPERPPSKEMKFKYFLAMGDEDFNYPEVVTLREQLANAGMTHRIHVYPAAHRWPPKEVWEEALRWMELHAIKDGTKEKDLERVRELLYRGAPYAGPKDAYQQWLTLNQRIRDETGLMSTREAKQDLAILEIQKGREIRDGEKREREEVQKQFRLADEAMAIIVMLKREPAERVRTQPQATAAMSDLRKKSKKEPASADGRAARRAFAQVNAFAFETAEAALREKDFQLATSIFEVFAQSAPDSPFPHYHLARVAAVRGDAKRALKELNESVRLGLKDAKLLDVPEFEAMRGKPEFEELRKKIS